MFDFKSFNSPKFMKFYSDKMKISNTYQRIYKIDAFPKEFEFGLFRYTFDNLPCKVFYKTSPLKQNMAKAITKEKYKLTKDRSKAKDETLKAKLTNQIYELDEMIQDIVSSNNVVLDVAMIICVYGNTTKELDDNCEFVEIALSTKGYEISTCEFLQEQLYKEFIPLWSKTGLNKDLQYDYALPLTSRSVAGFWNFMYEEVRDYKGFLLGNEYYRKGMIKFNPFLYLDDKETSYENAITSGNVIIFGKTGFGKSSLLFKLVKHFISEKIQTIWIDPENKNAQLVKRYNGKNIYLGSNKSIINVFSLRTIGMDENEEFINPYDTSLAISNAIEDFKELLKFYHADTKAMVHEALTVVDKLIFDLYAEKGIVNPTFNEYKESDYPIIEDLLKKIQNEVAMLQQKNENSGFYYEQLVRLENYIQPFTTTLARYFNGHTNINITKDDKVIGIETGAISGKAGNDNLKCCIFYLLMQYISSIVYNNDYRKAVVWDEAHKYSLIGYSLSQLADLSKRIRKYNGINVVATQDITDIDADVMVRGVNGRTLGQTIITNSTYKIIMKVDTIEKYKGVIPINESEAEFLVKQAILGDCLFIKGKQHYLIHVFFSSDESEILLGLKK